MNSHSIGAPVHLHKMEDRGFGSLTYRPWWYQQGLTLKCHRYEPQSTFNPLRVLFYSIVYLFGPRELCNLFRTGQPFSNCALAVCELLQVFILKCIKLRSSIASQCSVIPCPRFVSSTLRLSICAFSFEEEIASSAMQMHRREPFVCQEWDNLGSRGCNVDIFALKFEMSQVDSLFPLVVYHSNLNIHSNLNSHRRVFA